MTVNHTHNLSVLASEKWEEDLERTAPWDAERIGDALNRTSPSKQRAATTTECSSNPMGSPVETL